MLSETPYQFAFSKGIPSVALSFLIIVLTLPGSSFAQKSRCVEVVKKSGIKRSKTPIALMVNLSNSDVNMTKATLEITDDGTPLSVQFIFRFGDKRFTFFPGDVLTIYFADGSRDEFLYAIKQPDHGEVKFTLIKVDNYYDKTVQEEDLLFYTKLLDVNMTSCRLQVNSTFAAMKISDEDAHTIRKTVVCLMDK